MPRVRASTVESRAESDERPAKKLKVDDVSKVQLLTARQIDQLEPGTLIQFSSMAEGVEIKELAPEEIEDRAPRCRDYRSSGSAVQP